MRHDGRADDTDGHVQHGGGSQGARKRCTSLGLSLRQVQQLAEAARPPTDPLHVLGLDLPTLCPLTTRRWLWMAAQTCSVSYRLAITAEELLEVLTTGDGTPTVISPIIHLPEEAPLQIVIMAVEQASQKSGVAISKIWCNLGQIAAAWSTTHLTSENLVAQPSNQNPYTAMNEE